MYDRLASMFNRHWSFWGGADCWPAIINRAMSHTGGGKWLDVCCGTGHLLQMITIAGFEATGLDLSEEVLDYAQLNAPGVKLVEGNAKKIRVFENYNVISCMGASINLFKSEDSLRKVLTSMTKYLNEGGIIIFDASTREGMVCNVDREFHFNDDKGDYIAKVHFDHELNQGEWHIKATYKNSQSSHHNMKCVEKLRPWEIDELHPVLSEFELTFDTMDADSLEEVDEDTVRVVYFCTKDA